MGMLGNLEISGGTSGGSGSVTHTAGNLTANELVIGNGVADLKTLGTLGTTVTVLHGNAAGAPTFGAVSLTADVSGDLPFNNLVPATAISVLVGRGAAAGTGDFQEITLGTGITMTGTVLSASVAQTTGTFTATAAMGTSGTVTLDTSFDTLAYTKIGRVVHVTGYLTFSSVSSPLGFLIIGGFPFTPLDTNERSCWGVPAIFSNGMGATVASPPVGQWRPSTAEIYIFDTSGGGTTNFGAGDLLAGTVIQIGLTYFATS